MADRFTVLASGSSGNAALLEANGFGLLIDCGLHPRTLTARLREINADWSRVNAVILTHTHGDHWKDLTLADLRSRKIPLYAHPAQLEQLSRSAPTYEPLQTANLTRPYHEHVPLEVAPGLSVWPVRVSHDADPTFAFRIDRLEPDGIVWSVGYASDLGCASDELISRFAGVDVLALEYNHDVHLEHKSRRPKVLIDRVLGDSGHLSNQQAAQVTAAIAARSAPGFPSHVVQLHLSRECNRPELANAAGRNSLAQLNPRAEVITAQQHGAARPVTLLRRPNTVTGVEGRKLAPPRPVPQVRTQPCLPGFEN